MTFKLVFSLLVFGLFLSGVASAAGPAAVNLGTAGSFAILSKSGISTTGTTSVVGDIGVSPIDATAITGFGLIMDSSNQFSTSSLVTGKAYAADYTPPTPTKMTTAISDMQAAYTDAAGRTNPTATELGAGNIDGMTIAPGLYKWGTGVIIPTGVTLSGGPDDVWIFQISQDLIVGNGAIITLSGGAQPQNVFWQLFGQATLGTTSDVKGIILSQTSIALNTGAKLNGRALAQTAVTLDANAVTAPSGSASPTPAPSPTPSANTPASPTPTASVSATVNPVRNPEPSTGTVHSVSPSASGSMPTPSVFASPRATAAAMITAGSSNGATPKPSETAGGNGAFATSEPNGQTQAEKDTLAAMFAPTATMAFAILALGIVSAAGLYYYFNFMKK